MSDQEEVFENCAHCQQNNIELSEKEKEQGNFICPNCEIKNPIINDSSLSTEEFLVNEFTQNSLYFEEFQNSQKIQNYNFPFNFSAAFFGATWCFFKKQYWVGIFLMLMSFFVPFCLAKLIIISNPHDFSISELNVYIPFISFFLIRIPFGFLATKIYLNNAQSFVQELRKNLGSKSAMIRKAKEEGGESFENAFAFFILMVIISATLGKK